METQGGRVVDRQARGHGAMHDSRDRERMFDDGKGMPISKACFDGQSGCIVQHGSGFRDKRRKRCLEWYDGAPR